MIEHQQSTTGNTIGGTLGGLALVLFDIGFKDIVHTAMIAGIGATASFLVSFLLNTIVSYIKKRIQKE